LGDMKGLSILDEVPLWTAARRQHFYPVPYRETEDHLKILKPQNDTEVARYISCKAVTGRSV